MPCVRGEGEPDVIRVLVVDDHAAFRQPLAHMLLLEPDMTSIAEAGSLAEARAAMATLGQELDVAIVDLGLPDGSGADFVRDLTSTSSGAAVLVLTASEDPVVLAQAIEAGAAGVLQKWIGLDAIIGAVRSLAAGEVLHSSKDVVEALRLVGQHREQNEHGQALLDTLTPREREVIAALADGLSDKEIAHRLGISPDTARNHMVNIIGKLGVESRLQALLFAVRHGAIRIG